MLASVALQILPETLDDEQTIKVVDEVIAYMKSTGLECYVAPFETAIEGKVVDEVIAYMKSTGLECYVAPFETAIEGSDIDQLMDIMKECLHIAGKANNKGVAAFIKVVYRPDGDVLTIEKKVTKHHI